MAESKITKLAFSKAFKELMGVIPFQKINIADICEKCSKNRKSFYYHFKDKYDLANITFDMEFPYLKRSSDRESVKAAVKELCRYLYENKSYYRKLFEVEGQNSFSEHLRNELRSFFLCNITSCDSFTRIFWSDAVFYSVKEWISANNCAHYSEFYEQLNSCIRIDNSVS